MITTQQVAIQTVCQFLDVGTLGFLEGSVAFVSDFLEVCPGLRSADSFCKRAITADVNSDVRITNFGFFQSDDADCKIDYTRKG